MTTRRAASFGLVTLLVATGGALVASCSDSPSGGAVDAGRESSITPDKDAACTFDISDAKWKRIVTSDGLARITNVSFDKAGTMYAVGRVYVSVDFGAGKLPSPSTNDGIFVAAFDKDGKALWGRVLGEVVGEAEESVAAFPDGGAVVTAHLEQTETKQFGGFVVTRFDAAGSITWTKEVGATAEAAVAITSDGSGIVLAGGLVRSLPLEGCPLGDVPAEVGDAGIEGGTDAGDGGVDAGPPSERADAFVAKLSASTGICSWGKVFGGDRDEQSIRRVALDASGSIFVAGDFTGTFDLGGDELVGPPDSAKSGGLFLRPNGAAFVAKLTGDGAHIWSRSFANADAKSRSYVKGFVAMADGAVALSAASNGTIDFGTGAVTASQASSLAIFESTGATRYAKVYKTGDRASLYTLATDAASNLYMVGHTDAVFDLGDAKLGDTFGDGGLVLASFGPSGAYRSSRLYPACSGKSMQANAAGVTPAGDVFLAGAFDITNPAGPLIGTTVLATVPAVPLLSK